MNIFKHAPIFLVLILLVAGRFLLATSVPLTDTTEARYAEIARKMVETGDWITPQHDHGVPFWGKPPLAFWLSATGIALWGATEWAPRAFIFFIALGYAVYFYSWLRKWLDNQSALLGLLCLASSGAFYLSMAVVMTDLILMACVGITLMVFWNQCQKQNAQEWLLYIAIALGILTKGLITLFFTCVPIALWTVLTWRIGFIWKRFSWIKGACLIALIVMPWHILAELRTPGFLDYYILGEHFKRFLVKGWSGDLYGYAHSYRLGTIWLFLFLGMLPWSIVWPIVLIKNRFKIKENFKKRGAWLLFLACWVLAPMGLFTFSKNIIWPYMLPAAPACVAIMMTLLRNKQEPFTYTATAGGLVVLSLVGFIGVTFNLLPLYKSSQKYVIESLSSDNTPVYYLGRRYYSADYYSHGRAFVLKDKKALKEKVASGEPFYFILPQKQKKEIPEEILNKMHLEKTVYNCLILNNAQNTTIQ